MKVLVLGNSASRWQKEFIRNVLLPLGHEVYVSAARGNDPFEVFYKEHGVNYVVPKPVSDFIMRIPKVRAEAMLRHQVAALQNNAPYDVIINMFATSSELRCARLLSGGTATVIAYFCGSDILRVEGYKLKFLEKELKKVDRVCFASEQVRDGYTKKIGENNNAVVHLGISVFDWIDKIKNSSREVKKELGIPSDVTTICIGYNANEAHQHIKVIRQIELLPDDVKESVFLLLPMTYGRQQEYVDQVKQCLAESSLQHLVLETFMNDEQMAQLHCATDIFINAQKTDGLSASVLESAYAGAKLINASWLDYPDFSDWKLSYKAFNSFEDLRDVLNEVSSRKTIDTQYNHDILKNKMSWESTKKSWKAILNDWSNRR